MKVGLKLNSRSNHENHHFPNLINAKTYSASYTQPQSSEARSKVEAISLSIHSFKTHVLTTYYVPAMWWVLGTQQ